ncbi:hypothetical protein V6N13_059452 [Hibiscus sabdariffa]|uniref:MIT domain-containing protein n=1 Tax=Hibiscus sabdariffa TaxID=183260 RepID=A0ABR2GDG5_9ROSI
MYSNFKEQAIECVKQTVQEDNAGNYNKAFKYFKTHLKYKKSPKIRETITQKFTEYLRRLRRSVLFSMNEVLDQLLMGMMLLLPNPKVSLKIVVMVEKAVRGGSRKCCDSVILPVKFPQFFCRLCKKLGW